MSAENPSPAQTNLSRPLMVIAVLAVVAFLFLARDVLIPVALAIFLCFVLSPVATYLDRLRLGRLVSTLIVVFAFFGLAGGLGWVVAAQANQLVGNFERYRSNLSAKFITVEAVGRRTFNNVKSIFTPHAGAEIGATNPPDPTAAAQPVPVQVISDSTDSAGAFRIVLGYLGTVLHPVATAFVTLVLVVFFLFFRDDLRDRLLRICGRARINVTTSALTDSAQRLERYIAAQLFANVLIGATIGTGLFFMGIPNALLWGVLSAVLRFIPYLGAIVAALFPVTLAAATGDSWLLPLMTLGWILAVDSLSAHVLEPWLFGSTTGVSPPALLVAYLFWTWIWGGVGLVLATPLTVCLIVLGKHVPAFEIFYVLFGDEPVFETRTRYYQRLLAGDREGALRIAKEQLREMSPLAVLDITILPALAQIERDRQANLMNPERIDFVREVVIRTIDAIIPEPAASVEESGVKQQPKRLVVLDRGAFDDLIPRILDRIRGEAIVAMDVLGKEALVGEVSEAAKTGDYREIVLVAIQPPDFARLSLLAKRLPITASQRFLLLTTTPQRATARYSKQLGDLGRVVSIQELALALGLASITDKEMPGDKTPSRELIVPSTPSPDLPTNASQEMQMN